MIKLKEGQKLIGEDGNTYAVESGDYIQSKEIKESKTMKKVDTKKVSEKKGKVEIVLTKNYLIENEIIPAGTKVLVEADDIYDDFSTPSNIADASVPNSEDDIYTMRRMARMNRMNRMDAEEEFIPMRRMDVADDSIVEDDDMDADDYSDEELVLMRRLARMKRMRQMRRMAKADKKEEEEDKEEK